jgi:hypothetical protein
MPAFLDGLFISEILADNPGSGTNTDGDNSANKSDEFVEIQNNSGATIDLSGYQIWSQTNGLLYDFDDALGTPTVADGATATVVGEYTETPTNPLPSGYYDAGLNDGDNFLPDGETSGSNVRADVIYLLNTDTGEYIYLSYGEDPLTVSPPFPTAGTTLVGGEVISSGAPNGTSILRDADGNLIEGTPTPGVGGPVCFAAGTMITTDQGDVAVDDLLPGMRVLSKDNGYIPLRAACKAMIGRAMLRWHPDVRAVVVPAGVVGNQRPLRLSPAHRLLFSNPTAEMLFGEADVLLSARQLVGRAGVHVDMTHQHVTYFHLLFDQHEIICAEGCWSESLFLGDAAHAAIAASAKWQTQAGVVLDAMHHGQTARPVLKGYEAACLLSDLGYAEQNTSIAA